MKRRKNVLMVVMVVTAVLWVGCASSAPAVASSAPAAVSNSYPQELSNWIAQHEGVDAYYGTGISEFENQSDALQQATILARQDLAGNIQTVVAGIGTNMTKYLEGKGAKDKVAQFENSTKQIIDATLTNQKTVGPFVNAKGYTYIIKYIEKGALEKDLAESVKETFAVTESELNQILGL